MFCIRSEAEVWKEWKEQTIVTRSVSPSLLPAKNNFNRDRQWTYKRTIAVCSCHHCCSGKALSISYSECVVVTLGIQHVKRMYHIVIFGLPGPTIFFHIISKRHDFRTKKKKLFNITVCFDFICNSEKFVTVSTNERDIIKRACWSSCEVLITYRHELNLNILDRFSKKNTQTSNFRKIQPVGAEHF
jgi:hypothetical protein